MVPGAVLVESQRFEDILGLFDGRDRLPRHPGPRGKPGGQTRKRRLIGGGQAAAAA